MYEARLIVDDLSVAFETDNARAFEYVTTRDHLLGIKPFRCETSARGPAERRAVYLDRAAYGVEYDADAGSMTYRIPWREDVPDLYEEGASFHSMLLYPIRLLVESVWQDRGEYLIHGSAAARDGAAVVVTGGAEAGKSTTAIDLCRNHGFSFLANDQLLMGLRGGDPWLLRGDDVVNLRLKSLSRYSAGLTAALCGAGVDVLQPWDVKKEVPPSALSLDQTDAPARVVAFIDIKLDETVGHTVANHLSPGEHNQGERVDLRRQFEAKLDLFKSLSVAIRGAEFTPLREPDSQAIPLFMPSLDTEELLARRTRFLNALFDGQRIATLSLRGPLESCTNAIVEVFEAMYERLDVSPAPDGGDEVGGREGDARAPAARGGRPGEDLAPDDVGA